MSRRTPRSTLFPYTTLFRSTGRDAADFYSVVSQLKMKRFRNPCHSMLGPTIATHLSDPVRCRTRSYVNNMSCTCFFHSRYHSLSCIKDCVHIEIKKLSAPLS